MINAPDWWPAPAKLNLFLHITGRRADGYHRLQTVFQFQEYGDRLAFIPRIDDHIKRCTPLAGVGNEDDLCVRAARLLREHVGGRDGIDIYIDKRLPMGGGLGGGSSDAATTLLVLNRLWGAGLEQSQLAALGLQLGADVPVFVHGHAAWAEGVGEALVPIEPPETWFVVLIPDCQVATADIFSAPQLKRDCQPITIGGFLSGRNTSQVENVCEAVVRKRFPPVAAALNWLAQFGAARMSGTGACVFVTLSSRSEADAVFQQLPSEFTSLVARGINHSPVLDKLEWVE